MPKPIDDIKEDLQSVIFSVNKLELNLQELRQINKDMLYKIQQSIDYSEKVIVKKPITKGWFY